MSQRQEELTKGYEQIRWHMHGEPVFCDNDLRVYSIRSTVTGYEVRTLEGWRKPERVYIKRPLRLGQ